MTAGDPLQLTIAADARLSDPNYADDHIWQLDLGGGDPSALGLRTTYGLRARLMRIFPRFFQNGKIINDPVDFARGPAVRFFAPNFLDVDFSPLVGLDVRAEYWVAGSNVVAGRITLSNRAVTPLSISVELAGQLIPIEGQPMSAAQRQSVSVLEGKVANLSPVLFLTGGPQPGPGPYPALVLPLELPPGNSRQFSWALAALPDPQDSFDLARRTAARPFDAERARIELLTQSQTVEIHTGDKDWDAALAFSQKAAFGLFLGKSEHLPHNSFALVRQPDLGYSPLGDGSDHQHFWNGQPPLESYYLSTVIPGSPELACGLLKNFLATQDQDGEIDAKPGLAGQRTRFLAAPYLASLAWNCHQRHPDKSFLQQVYPGLNKFFWSWFSPRRDHDRNGLPEWQHVSQTGFDDNPLFDGWHTWAQGVDITTVQSPALSAALYREASLLCKMADLLGRTSDLTLLRKQMETLREGIAACWDPESFFYHYADRDTHLSPSGKILSDRQAASELDLQKDLKQACRLIIRIHGHGEALKRPRVTITGTLDGREQSESLDRHDFSFSAAGAVTTSQKVYDSVGHFEFEGLTRRDRITIQTVDLTISDQTLLLPLWAGIPDEQQAGALVHRTILNADRFDHPYGVSALPRVFVRDADPVCLSVHVPWNHLIAEGLLAYGYRREAARLVVHVMSAIISNLKRSQSFYRAYHAETGAGQGERDSLRGLAPVGLFLQTLGVEILSPKQVRIWDENPFPWPVTVKYRGLTISRLLDHTEVIFPNGQSTQVSHPADTLVSIP
ncbi:MAG: hypothetical protein CVU44_18500 [Chloroflexi bacterium HGW-Chloroflexi-6]|nr:MAG: hypothetical protein CVU44_18500 [Chloroflexi bacterium HGW-Chloroflexi-6]